MKGPPESRTEQRRKAKTYDEPTPHRHPYADRSRGSPAGSILTAARVGAGLNRRTFDRARDWRGMHVRIRTLRPRRLAPRPLATLRRLPQAEVAPPLRRHRRAEAAGRAAHRDRQRHTLIRRGPHLRVQPAHQPDGERAFHAREQDESRPLQRARRSDPARTGLARHRVRRHQRRGQGVDTRPRSREAA